MGGQSWAIRNPADPGGVGGSGPLSAATRVVVEVGMIEDGLLDDYMEQVAVVGGIVVCGLEGLGACGDQVDESVKGCCDVRVVGEL